MRRTGGVHRVTPATGISRPSISHGLHNACGRDSDVDDDEDEGDVGVLPRKSPLHLSLSLSGVGRLTGQSGRQNPASRVTAGFQPPEESRQYLCLSSLDPPATPRCFHGRLVNLVSGDFGIRLSRRWNCPCVCRDRDRAILLLSCSPNVPCVLLHFPLTYAQRKT